MVSNRMGGLRINTRTQQREDRGTSDVFATICTRADRRVTGGGEPIADLPITSILIYTI